MQRAVQLHGRHNPGSKYVRLPCCLVSCPHVAAPRHGALPRGLSQCSCGASPALRAFKPTGARNADQSTFATFTICRLRKRDWQVMERGCFIDLHKLPPLSRMLL